MPSLNHYENIVVFKTDDESINIDVIFENDTVWLTQDQMSALFQKAKSTINSHINNIFEEKELEKRDCLRKFDFIEFSHKPENYYNLDVIISVGYRVKSRRGTEFRKWATKRLNEYIRKGFVLDDERLKNLGGTGYWKELLDRIRDIRSSEKVLYRQVLDLYATSVDYDPKSEMSVMFFRIVQNKLHFAAHGHTAAEIIYERADAEKPFMGLTSFSGELPALKDITIAKNYLDADELKILNNLVSGYFDLAEINAIEHRPMYMEDYVKQLDAILSSGGRKILSGPGTISHQKAVDKAVTEYRKYQNEHLSPVETAYLETIRELGDAAKKKAREVKNNSSSN
ncbi:MAG TPA: virulence RhuM family protein [Methanocorpusculum sp.]|nr:virulence RhuM family protein [Methanocorpusculum sp.]